MKLRWKHFLVLFSASLIPLLAVTWITQNASRRLGNTISVKAQNILTDTVRQEMVRVTRSYAAFSHLGGVTTKLALMVLAAKAELALTLPPPPSAKIFYAADFDDPQSAPEDMALSKSHPIRSECGAETYQPISRNHPNFLLAPGTIKEDVAGDILRFTRLSPALRSLNQGYGEGLIWSYVSLENGVHISYPGHGGYPAGYDPRKRLWYKMAKKAEAPTWVPMVDATTGQFILTLAMPFKRPDGSLAGVAGMDIKIAHALMESETTSSWSQKMSSFIVGAETDSQLKKRKIWVISSQQKTPPPTPHAAVEIFSQSSEIEVLFDRIKNKKSGSFDMPYKGVDSLWAYAAMIADQYFVIVVPKSEIMTLPEEVGQMFVEYSKDQRTITGIAVVLSLFLLGIVAFFTSRLSTIHMLTIIDAWKRLAKGDFTGKLKARMKDERAQLIHAFNEIVPKLEEHLSIITALAVAQEVQQSLLPKDDPTLKGFDISGSSVYCHATGGDYYDFIDIGRGRLAVVVGDVSGHGVESALLMATARALIMMRAYMPGPAASVINDVNKQLSIDTYDTGNFMTLFYCELTPSAPEVCWIRAGHDPALIYDPDTDRFDELKGQGLALGLDISFEYNSFHRRIEPGQVIMIGTDGIWEMHNQAGEMFGKEALMEIIRNNHWASARQIVATITDTLERFREDKVQEDDITLVVIKVDR